MKNRTVLYLLSPVFALMVQGCTGGAKHEYAPLDIDQDLAALDHQNAVALSKIEKLKKESLDEQGLIYWDSRKKTGVVHSAPPKLLQESQLSWSRECKEYYGFSSMCAKWYYFTSPTKADYGWGFDDQVQKLAVNQNGQVLICKDDNLSCKLAGKEMIRLINKNGFKPS